MTPCGRKGFIQDAVIEWEVFATSIKLDTISDAVTQIGNLEN